MSVAFAVGPGDFFDDDCAAVAVDSAHGIQQEDQESPEGNELEAPSRKLIVVGRRLMAARADRDRALARSHGDSIVLWSGLNRAR